MPDGSKKQAGEVAQRPPQDVTPLDIGLRPGQIEIVTFASVPRSWPITFQHALQICRDAQELRRAARTAPAVRLAHIASNVFRFWHEFCYFESTASSLLNRNVDEMRAVRGLLRFANDILAEARIFIRNSLYASTPSDFSFVDSMSSRFPLELATPTREEGISDYRAISSQSSLAGERLNVTTATVFRERIEFYREEFRNALRAASDAPASDESARDGRTFRPASHDPGAEALDRLTFVEDEISRQPKDVSEACKHELVEARAVAQATRDEIRRWRELSSALSSPVTTVQVFLAALGQTTNFAAQTEDPEERCRLAQLFLDHAHRSLSKATVKHFGSVESNRLVVDRLQKALDHFLADVQFAFPCPKCRKPSRFAFNPQPNVKTGQFRFRHLDNHKVCVSSKDFPRLALIVTTAT